MKAKDIIKQASMPHIVNYGLGALGPVLRSARKDTPPGELMARSIGAGMGGVGGAYGGGKIGMAGRKQLTKLMDKLVAKGKGRSRILSALATASPYVGDALGFIIASTMGSHVGKRLHGGAKSVMHRKWGKDNPKGLLKAVALPTASAYEAVQQAAK